MSTIGTVATSLRSGGPGQFAHSPPRRGPRNLWLAGFQPLGAGERRAPRVVRQAVDGDGPAPRDHGALPTALQSMVRLGTCLPPQCGHMFRLPIGGGGPRKRLFTPSDPPCAPEGGFRLRLMPVVPSSIAWVRHCLRATAGTEQCPRKCRHPRHVAFGLNPANFALGNRRRLW
jgi:hypothetical protein